MGAKSPLGKKSKKEEAALAKEAAQQAAVAKETEGLAASAAALGQELRDQEDVVIQGILKQYEKEEGLTFASAEERTKKEEELRAEYRVTFSETVSFGLPKSCRNQSGGLDSLA